MVTDFPVVRRERFTVVGLPLRIFPEGFLLRAFRARTVHRVFQMDLLRRIIRAGSPLPDLMSLAAAQIIDCGIPGRIRLIHDRAPAIPRDTVIQEATTITAAADSIGRSQRCQT